MRERKVSERGGKEGNYEGRPVHACVCVCVNQKASQLRQRFHLVDTQRYAALFFIHKISRIFCLIFSGFFGDSNDFFNKYNVINEVNFLHF